MPFQRQRRSRLFSDIGLISFSVLLIVAATLSWITYKEYDQVQEAEFRLLGAHARSAEVQVSEALNNINQTLGRLADVAAASPSGLHDRYTPLNDFRERLKRSDVVFVADRQGLIRSTSRSALHDVDVSHEAYFAVHRDAQQTSGLYISRPQVRLGDSVKLVFSRPVLGAKGEFLGIVAASFDYQFFPALLQAANPDDSASMTVIFNRQGDLLFRIEQPETFFGRSISGVSTVYHEHIAGAGPTSRHQGPSAHNGKTRLFLVRDIGNTGLSLILSRQLDEVLLQWRWHVFAYALIFVFSTAVVVPLTILAARRKREVLAGKAFAENLIATANVMVVGLDAQGRISIFNEAAERISGYRKEELIGRDLGQIKHTHLSGADLDSQMQTFVHYGRLPRAAEYPIRTKSGEGRLIAWQNSVIAEPRSAICFGIDITERKRMETDLATAKQRAEEANRAKSKFLAAVSHDLRQPIDAQGLFLAVLARTELNPAQRDMLNNITLASRSAVAMLNTLLEFSRLEAGIIRPRMQTLQLQPLLNKIEREFGPLADAKNLNYRSRETAMVVRSDPILLELILRNLVSNAIRYTAQGGVFVACRRRPGVALIEVWDTGIGIAPENQKAIFQEFVQVDGGGVDGLGLGLAIVDGLSRSLGHTVTLASQLGHGSVFRLQVALAETKQPVWAG